MYTWCCFVSCCSCTAGVWFQSCPVHHVLAFHILTRHMMQMFHVRPVHLVLVLHVSASELDFEFVFFLSSCMSFVCSSCPHFVDVSYPSCPPCERFSHVFRTPGVGVSCLSCTAGVGCSYCTNPTRVDVFHYSCPLGFGFLVISEHRVLVSYISPIPLVLVLQMVHVHNVLVFQLLASISCLCFIGCTPTLCRLFICLSFAVWC